ncbi:MAG: OmpA family protein [Sulfuritalea sp.]|nr:OmpA family protein [Sulfuritalea sp.]
MNRLMFAGSLVVMAGSLAAGAPAAAQSLEKPSKMDLISRFTHDYVTKGFRPLKTADLAQCGGNETIATANKGGAMTKTLVATSAGTAAVNLDVSFKYNSDELTSDAKAVLDEVGGALADSRLRASRFMVTGHTDETGAEDYNFRLSCARAVSVRNYLAKEHRIDKDRLVLKGAGFSQLLDKANPQSEVNRRVELRKAAE